MSYLSLSLTLHTRVTRADPPLSRYIYTLVLLHLLTTATCAYIRMYACVCVPQAGGEDVVDSVAKKPVKPADVPDSSIDPRLQVFWISLSLLPPVSVRLPLLFSFFCSSCPSLSLPLFPCLSPCLSWPSPSFSPSSFLCVYIVYSYSVAMSNYIPHLVALYIYNILSRGM